MFREAIRRLWLIATCDHINKCRAIVWEDSTELRFCTKCGTLVKFTNEGVVHNNPHLEWSEVSGFGPSS
jgi:hypothetical protein